MLVYGDIEGQARPAELRRRIAEKLLAVERAPAGRKRHEMLVTAFIETGVLLQGLADEAFAVRQADDVSPVQQSGAALLRELAQAVKLSWDGGFGGVLTLPHNWHGRLRLMDSTAPTTNRSAA